jgi:stage 0 sporulation protein B (sporulation initiation phosphotransferase)
MNKEWNAVELLRHARHDWLNKIQLIKGNLDLNKPERVKQLIEEIIIEAQQEAKLSNLKLPHFATFMLTSNWKGYPFQLEFEVIDDGEVGDADDRVLTEWMNAFFACLHTTVEALGENHLFVSIQTQKNGIRFFFNFNGIIKDKDKIQQFLETMNDGKMIVNLLELTQQGFAIEVFIQYR